MTLREIMDYVYIQGNVMISEVDTEDFEMLFISDDIEYEENEISDDILNMYVKYMFSIDNCLKIEVSKERY